MKRLFPLLFIIAFTMNAQLGVAQVMGTLEGKATDANTGIPLIGVSVAIEGTSYGATTDMDGSYFLQVPVGSYNIVATYIGYATVTKYNQVITSGNIVQLSFVLNEAAVELQEVTVTANSAKSAAAGDIVTPLSVQRLSTQEIKSNPGGNFDISRVVQALPGVGGTAGSVGGFRNDIVIRGGGPNENVYYLDGIEIPVINHFSTQGSAGGPTCILNVSFIEDVKLSSSAFDARYDNALASVFEFDQRDGNSQGMEGNFRLSATEAALTLDGPLSKNLNYIVSARRSYLQLLFEALDLPIRPNYWDFQTKLTWQASSRTTVSFIGVGAIDEFSFKPAKEATAENVYILNSNPLINQWNYTAGVSVKHLIANGYITASLSRNDYQNRLDKFEDNIAMDETDRTLKVVSNETENKFRLTVDKYVKGWKYAFGGVLQQVGFTNDYYNRIRKELRDSNGNIIQNALAFNFNTNLQFWKYGFFGQLSKSVFNDKLGLSFGLRTDMNSFTQSGNQPLKTLSPRLAASYRINDQWKINSSVGKYFKIPIYTVLGFQNQAGDYVNKNSQYIASTHYVAGVEYLPKEDLRFTMEGFYKKYDRYPVSLLTGISLANQGGEFGAIGNEAITSSGKGEAYGFEVYGQQKLTGSLFAVVSYTFVRSKFSGVNGLSIPSAWDNRHLFSLILGKKLGRGWELGLKYRYAGGAPYTPFDATLSQQNYLTIGTGILDYNQLNTLRLKSFSQFDLRLDKKWNYRNWTLDLFLDVQNLLVTRNPAYPQYTFRRLADNSGFATTDGQPLQENGSNAIPLILVNDDAIATPSIGLIVEF
jgi:outer membrane receptor for ferrienterochelin and colicin